MFDLRHVLRRAELRHNTVHNNFHVTTHPSNQSRQHRDRADLACTDQGSGNGPHGCVAQSDVLRANSGHDPWQQHNHVITSVYRVSIIDDAGESLLRSRWDLTNVAEAHRMTARFDDRPTQACDSGSVS